MARSVVERSGMSASLIAHLDPWSRDETPAVSRRR